MKNGTEMFDKMLGQLDFAQILLVLVVGFVAVKLTMTILKHGFRRSKLSPEMQPFLLSIIRILLLVFWIIALLSTFGFDTASIITMFGVVGLAVSLALQGVLSNIASGVVLLFTHPFRLGDYIQVDTTEGSVRKTDLLYTELATIDNKIIYIPNAQITASKLVNFSQEETRRLDLLLAISYRDDVSHAQRVLSEIIAAHGSVLADPPPLIRVADLSLHAVTLTVRVWVKTPAYFAVKFDLLEEIKRRFDQEGLQFPFDQLGTAMQQLAREAVAQQPQK